MLSDGNYASELKLLSVLEVTTVDSFICCFNLFRYLAAIILLDITYEDVVFHDNRAFEIF